MKIENNDHDVVYLKVKNMEAYIDEELAPIIKILWKNNIETSACCQENTPETAHIVFPTSNDAANFVKFLLGKKKVSYLSKQGLKNSEDKLNDIETNILSWGTGGFSWSCAFLYDSGVFNIHLDFPKNKIPELLKTLKRKK